jgi:hypothetical protein
VIVVGDADGGQAGLPGAFDEFAGGKSAVGKRCVKMEIRFTIHAARVGVRKNGRRTQIL